MTPPDVERLAAGIPFGQEGLTAVAQPIIEIAIAVTWPDHVMRHFAWVNQEWTYFLLAVRGEEYRAIVVPSGQTPAGLARVLRLGPYARGAEVFRFAPEKLDSLAAGDSETMSEFGLKAAWFVNAQLTDLADRDEAADEDDSVRRICSVRDSGGQYVVSVDELGAIAEPARTTEIWAVITSLMMK